MHHHALTPAGTWPSLQRRQRHVRGQCTQSCPAWQTPIRCCHGTRCLGWIGVSLRAMLLLLGLLLPYLAYLLVQQLYLAATAQTARECFRR